MISIIIVGYNSEKYLDDCLSSIFLSIYEKFKVIFVDNNSNDNSIKLIEEKFDRVEIVRSKINLGFAAGNNLGINLALKDNPDYIFLLNPDTVIDPSCIKELIKRADNKTILQPLVLLHNGKQKTNSVNTAGNILNFLGFSYCGEYKKDIKEIVSDRDITLASGAAMFVPTKIIRRIGSFDETFFMYHEDVDLSWRARIAGYNIKLIKDSRVWHKYSFSRNRSKMYYIERNRLLFMYKNFSLKYLILILPVFLVNEILMFFYAILTGWGILKFKASWDALTLVPSISKKRKLDYRITKVTESKLKILINNKIIFSEIGKPFIFWPYNATIGLYWKLIYPFI